MDESKYLLLCNTKVCSIKVEIILFYAVHSFLYSATASFVFANNHVYTIKLHFVATLFLQFQCNINKFIWQGRHEKHHFGRYVPHATRNSGGINPKCGTNIKSGGQTVKVESF